MRSPSKAGLVMMRVAHLVHQVEHLLVAGVGVLGDAVQLQRLGVLPPLWSSAAMKPAPLLRLLELLLVHPYLLTNRRESA